MEIVTGKFLSVFSVAAISGASNILAMGLMFGMVSMADDLDTAKIEFTLSWFQMMLITITVLLTGLMFSALMMTVAVLARSHKEAQTYMTLVFLLSVAPAIYAQFPGVGLTGMLQFAPCLNLALLLRAIFEEQVTAQNLFIVGVSTLVYTLGALSVAARIFKREAILLGEVGLSGLFEGSRRQLRTIPLPSEAVAMTIVSFILLFYAGGALTGYDVLLGAFLSQWLVILVPVLVFVRLMGFNARQTLALRLPPVHVMVAAVLLGLSLPYLLNLAMSGLFEPERIADDPFVKLMTDLVEGNSVWVLVIVFGLGPAVCEEVLFRGLLLGALEKHLRPMSVALVTAIVFGAFHMSVIRFFPTALLGLILAMLTMTSRSIFPAMLFHFINNALAVTTMKLSWELPGMTPGSTPAWWHVGMALLCALLAFFLLRTGRKSTA